VEIAGSPLPATSWSGTALAGIRAPGRLAVCWS